MLGDILDGIIPRILNPPNDVQIRTIYLFILLLTGLTVSALDNIARVTTNLSI